MTTFKQIPVGGRFMCNGNECVKRSTRTALLIQYGRVFYFGNDYVVKPLGGSQ